LLSSFSKVPGAGSLTAFHASFLCMGVITATSAWIFWQLPPDVHPSHKPEAEVETEIA
jgi:hypothetical protein